MRLHVAALIAPSVVLCSAAVAATPLPTYDQVGLRWKNPPNVVDMAKQYPTRAKVKNIGRGLAEVSCTARGNGRLDCRTINEYPANVGFGDAALNVMRRASVESVDGRTPAGRTFGFRLRFGAWSAKSLPDQFQPGPGLRWAAFPTMTEWNMTGQDRYETWKASFDCLGQADGRVDCRPTGSDPEAPAFLNAASQAMSKARIERADGQSPEGARFSWTVSVMRQNWCSPGKEDIFQGDGTPASSARCIPGQVQIR